MDLGQTLVKLERDITALQRASRLGHSSIENAAVLVNDGSGSLRGIIGVQADGTTAVTIVNGAAPPQPSPALLANGIIGITATWDGTFDGGAIMPLDWQRVEVHASTTNGFTPDASSLQGTIETPQGSTVVIPCDDPVYVRLVSRNTSGTASTASTQSGPLGPTPVVADDILDGAVTELKLANNAVTEAKIAANAVGTVALQDGAVLAENLADAAVAVGKIADNAVTGPAIASDAVTAGKIAANAVTAGKIQAGAVTAAAVAAGAITTDKLTVTGGANILSDPSFEGAYSAGLVSGNANWSIDTTGTGSAKSLKVNAVAGATTTRTLAITTVPILAGDQLYLAVDYLTSSDYTATASVRIYALWMDSAGATTGFGVVQASPPVIGGSTWNRPTGTVTAPANTVRAEIRVESNSASAGWVTFDNAVARPVLAGVQIQDGAISTPKIVAGAVQATQIAAGAVLTDKLAADSVTAAKILALTITGDKLAANTITVGKLAAGSVDATALAADAITGKTITGGTITGALIQTASSGQRITLNEAGANKVIVYNASGVAIGELSASGLLVKGTNGAIIQLDPNSAFPNLRFYNAANTNSAVINISGTDSVLGLNSGQFAPGDGNTDWKWRTLFGNGTSGDFWAAERVRDSSPATTYLGGRVYLESNRALVGFYNAADSTQNAFASFTQGLLQVGGARLAVAPPASSNAGALVNVLSSHTGNLLQLQQNAVDKFVVDASGNLTVAGIGQRLPKRRTSNATRTSTITPSADTQLTWTVDANAVYALEGILFYAGPGDFLMGWTYPSGAAGTWQGIGNGTTVVSGTAGGGTQQDITSSWGYTTRTETTDLADNRTYGGISSTGFAVQVRATIRVGGTGGTFALQWAQGSSNATATTLYTDSRLTLEKIG
ncbi:MAG: hypothetical protein HOY75_08495 [Streptomyces sp.]|nr:hypothetical protein [Streptomyces sp.]